MPNVDAFGAQETSTSFLLKISFLEVYNERVHDLIGQITRDNLTRKKTTRRSPPDSRARHVRRGCQDVPGSAGGGRRDFLRSGAHQGTFDTRPPPPPPAPLPLRTPPPVPFACRHHAVAPRPDRRDESRRRDAAHQGRGQPAPDRQHRIGPLLQPTRALSPQTLARRLMHAHNATERPVVPVALDPNGVHREDGAPPRLGEVRAMCLALPCCAFPSLAWHTHL